LETGFRSYVVELNEKNTHFILFLSLIILFHSVIMKRNRMKRKHELNEWNDERSERKCEFSFTGFFVLLIWLI